MARLLSQWRAMSAIDKAIWIGTGLVGVIAVIILALIVRSLDPAPPVHITIATGAEGGAYHAAGRMLEQHLEAEGVEVTLRPSAGSAENIDLLIFGEADVALIQGGVGLADARYEQLQSLAALFYEPMWIFVHADRQIEDMRGLSGLRIAAGEAQSGTRALLSSLLTRNGVEAFALTDAGGEAAAEDLLSGRVDAAVFITSPDRDYIRALLESDEVTVLSIRRAPAYGRLWPYLSDIVLPEGVIDLANNIPAHDVQMIAPSAVMVVPDRLHPAIQSLLLQAAHANFTEGTEISAPGDFPNRDLISFDLSNEARRYFNRGGPTFLERYLPFWAANLVDRLWILLIPALTLLYPLVKSAPPIYSWQLKRRIKKSYRDLRDLEQKAFRGANETERLEIQKTLKSIRDDVRDLPVPWTYFDEVYLLRTHIKFVEDLVEKDKETQGET